MAASALEARLLITAQDKTKAAFDSVLRRLDGVFERARSLGRVSESAGRAIARVEEPLGRVERSLAAAARTMDTSAHTMERAAAAIARAAHNLPTAPAGGGGGGGESRRRGHGHGHRIAAALAAGRSPEHIARHEAVEGGFTTSGAAGAVATYTGFEVGKEAIEKSAERQHERVRMEIAGMSPAERKEAEAHAAALAGKFPQVDQTSIMHTLRNARSITGSYEDAEAISADIMRMRLIANATKPGRDIEGETDLLLKAMEQHGDTKTTATFHDAMARIDRVLAVEGDTLGPADIYQGAKISRQALSGLSQRFLYGAAPAMMQEMGGASFGNAMSSFNRAFVSGRMDSRGLQSALDLGLINKEDVAFKGGKPTHMKSLTEGGHGFRNWRVAASDPDKYIYDTLIPALKKHGITSNEDIAAAVNVLMSNRMAGMFVNTFATQRGRIEKNQANLAKAPDDPAAIIMANDPQAAWQGVTNSFANLAAATDASGHGLTAALNAISTALNDQAARLQGVKTEHMLRMENQANYGLDSSQDLTKLSPDALASARQKALQEDAAKIVAAQLEIKGLVDEIHARDAERHGVLGWLGFGGRETSSLIGRVHELRASITELQAAMGRAKGLGEGQPSVRPGREDDPAFRAAAGVAAVPGPSHASFPLGSTYGHVDPVTGRNIAPAPAAPPYGGLGMAAASIKAQLEGSVKIDTTVTVGAASSLIAIVDKAQKVVSDNALLNASGRSFGLSVGTGAKDTGTQGRRP